MGVHSVDEPIHLTRLISCSLRPPPPEDSYLLARGRHLHLLAESYLMKMWPNSECEKQHLKHIGPFTVICTPDMVTPTVVIEIKTGMSPVTLKMGAIQLLCYMYLLGKYRGYLAVFQPKPFKLRKLYWFDRKPGVWRIIREWLYDRLKKGEWMPPIPDLCRYCTRKCDRVLREVDTFPLIDVVTEKLYGVKEKLDKYI